jgi:ADP-dependent NAD(P)H-hydrate dehydratase / NAD(P)H-hydrate epimerase
MKILTAEQMRAIDRTAIEGIGIPGAVLMENAGSRIADVIMGRFPDFARQSIVVAAGKGNNGGDGFVVARHLRNRGAEPVVLLLAPKSELKGDAALNQVAAEKSGVEVIDASTELCWKKQAMTLAHASIIVDAVFGTGLLKPAEGLYARAIEDMNRARGFRVAVDIPSGLSSDSFAILGPAVKADLTVALAAPKIAHVFPPASELVGELIVADIGIPPFLLEDDKLSMEMVERGTVLPHFAKRRRDGHKGTYGHLLVLAGSRGKAGAAVMAGKAALRMGAGLVTIATAASAVGAVGRGMMELMTASLPETREGTIAAEAVPAAEKAAKNKDAVVIGPGLTTPPSTAEFVRTLLPKLKMPLLIDADGLNILAGHLDILRSLPGPVILTPHPGEFARLTGLSTDEVLLRRLELAPKFAREHNIILVLKGYRTIVATPQGRIYINPTGNPGMATGGSGDVLSGMIGSLLVQSRDALGAALAAVYLHGLSGDLAAARLSEKALIAGDLIRFIPPAVKSLEDESA